MSQEIKLDPSWRTTGSKSYSISDFQKRAIEELEKEKDRKTYWMKDEINAYSSDEREIFAKAIEILKNLKA